MSQSSSYPNRTSQQFPLFQTLLDNFVKLTPNLLMLLNSGQQNTEILASSCLTIILQSFHQYLQISQEILLFLGLTSWGKLPQLKTREH